MTVEKKTRNELILDVLLTGNTFLLKDITQRLCESSGEKVKIQDIASLMTKLSNPGRCQTGYFIVKNWTKHGFEYSLVPEILSLAPEEIYGLTRKTGKDRFTLEMAVQKVPELGKYVKKSAKTLGKRKSAIKKPEKKKTPSRKKSAPKSDTGKTKAKTEKSKTLKKKPARETASETLETLVVPKPLLTDFMDSFSQEIQRIGGLRVNLYFTAKLLKNDGAKKD